MHKKAFYGKGYVKYIHAKNNLYFIFGLSEIHAFKEQNILFLVKVKYMHAKNHLNFVFGLSEVHASKEQFKFCF